MLDFPQASATPPTSANTSTSPPPSNLPPLNPNATASTSSVPMASDALINQPGLRQRISGKGKEKVPAPRWYTVSYELENKGSVARDHLANERTYLAWLRTSLSLASIGIAVTQLFRLSNFRAPASTLAAEPLFRLSNVDLTTTASLSDAPLASQELVALRALVVEQGRRLDALAGINGQPGRYAHLGKPVGGTFIMLALLFLGLGTLLRGSPGRSTITADVQRD